MIPLEKADGIVAEMVKKLVANGYEFEGSEEAFDPNKFVEAVATIAVEDDTLEEGVGAWLTDAVAQVKALNESAKVPPVSKSLKSKK